MSIVVPLIGLGIQAVSQHLTSSGAAAGEKKRMRELKQAKLSSPKRMALSSEGRSGSQVVPSAMGDIFPGLGLTTSTGAGGSCPGLFSVRLPDGRCVDLSALPPGGDPAITPGVDPRVETGFSFGAPAFGAPVLGLYGAGVLPEVEEVMTRRCPAGWKLGKDNVCYESLSRTQRKWDPGMKPLLSGGERAAIARAARAGRKLVTARKGLKKASAALGKAC
jgi:hypothetical protein